MGLPDLSQEWQLPWKTKKNLLGKKHMILVGGKTEEADDARKGHDRNSNAEEPVCFHSAPLALYEELIHDFFAKMVIDLTPCDARFAWACLQSRTAYLAIAYNEEHKKLMEERLLSQLAEAMAKENSPLFNKSYAAARDQKTETDQDQKTARPKGKAKAKAKAASAGKAKAKGKAKCKGKAKAKADASKKRKRTEENEADIQEREDEEQEEDEEEENEEDNDDIWDPLKEDE